MAHRHGRRRHIHRHLRHHVMALMPLQLLLLLLLILGDHAHVVRLLPVKAVGRGQLLRLWMLPDQLLVGRLVLYLRLLLHLMIMTLLLVSMWTAGRCCSTALEAQVPGGDEDGAPVGLLDAMVLLELGVLVVARVELVHAGFGVKRARDLPLVGVGHENLTGVGHGAQVDRHSGLTGLLGCGLRRLEVVSCLMLILLLLWVSWGMKGHFRCRYHLLMAAIQIYTIRTALSYLRLDLRLLW